MGSLKEETGLSLPAVALIATDGFSPFHLSVPCIIFGPVMPDRRLFDLHVCAEKPGLVQSDGGFSIQVENGLEQLCTADIIIAPYWHHPDEKPAPALLEALIAARRRGAEIVGLCLGTYVLAWAGLLNGRRATTHWEFERDFADRFPDVRLDINSLYVDDDRLITSAGTAAGIDCCLYLVRKHYGSALANRVARRMVIPPIREGGQAQFIERPVPETTKDGKINALLEYLRHNLAQPHTLDSLADYVCMSRRTFTRHFFKATGVAPGEWLNGERLQRSQQLLETTAHGIEAIAQLSGFRSPVSFRQSFKQKFGVSPAEWRRTFQQVKTSG